MLRKIASLVIATLLCQSFPAYAQTSSAQEIKLKRQVVERGTNQQVSIKLQSGETLQGNIAEIRNDSFTLQFVDAAGQVNTRDIAYSELSKVSKAGGKNLGGTVKRGFLLGVGIYLGMVAVAAAVIGITAAASR
jgi:hypothetical protein